MADVKIDNDDNIPGHLIIDVDVEAPRPESDDDHAIGGDVETSTGAAALTTAGAGAVTATGGDGVVSAATGASWAITTAGAGAITTAGARSMAVSTAGAGSVTVSGGVAAGGIDTSGAGSVNTYTGVPAKCNNVEERYSKKIPWTVGVIGGLTQATAAAAVLYRSPGGVAAHGGGEVAYLVGIASVLVAGLAEVVAAFWVSIDTQKRGATGKKIICLSVLTLLLAIALVGVAVVPKN